MCVTPPSSAERLDEEESPTALVSGRHRARAGTADAAVGDLDSEHTVGVANMKLARRPGMDHGVGHQLGDDEGCIVDKIIAADVDAELSNEPPGRTRSVAIRLEPTGPPGHAVADYHGATNITMITPLRR